MIFKYKFVGKSMKKNMPKISNLSIFQILKNHFLILILILKNMHPWIFDVIETLWSMSQYFFETKENKINVQSTTIYWKKASFWFCRHVACCLAIIVNKIKVSP